jgi:hypothetical protein
MFSFFLLCEHPFFVERSAYREAVLDVILEEDVHDSVKVFFEELRCRKLREVWVGNPPEKPQDFGYSAPVNELIFKHLSRSSELIGQAPVSRESSDAALVVADRKQDGFAPKLGPPVTSLVILDLGVSSSERVKKFGDFSAFNFEVFTGFDPSQDAQTSSVFKLQLPGELPGVSARPNYQVIAFVFSPYRIRQLRKLMPNGGGSLPIEAVINQSLEAGNFSDFTKAEDNRSRAAKYFDVFRFLPTLVGRTDDEGQILFEVPLLKDSPKVEPGSCVAICFGNWVFPVANSVPRSES